MLRARVLHDLGNVKETMSTLEQAAAAGAPVGEVAVERARLRMREGDLAGAARLLEEAIEKGGSEPGLVVAMARVEEARGDGEKAVTRLRQAASVYPNAHEIGAAQAAALSRLRRHEEAARVYQRLTVLAPQSPEYASGLADSLALSGKLQEALTEYRRAQKLPGASANIWVKTAVVHNALGDTNAAREAYEAALSRDGGNPFALNNLAYLLGRQGERMDYALQLAQNAGQIMPDSLEVQDTLIYVTLRMGLKQQALEILDRAAARSKPPSKAWFQSLRAQLGKGTPEDVLKRMEAARRERRDS
jgi:tetratricopeptide (TPR) repeat protein